MEIHRNVIDRYNNDEESLEINFIETDISICYVLKNGGRIVRNYGYGYIGADAAKTFAALTASDELKNQAADAHYAENMRNYDSLNGIFRERSAINPDYKPTFSVSYPFDDEHFSRVIDDREFYAALNNAYRNDLKNISAEKYLNPAKGTLYNIGNSYNMRMPGLNPDYRETLSVLSDEGLLPPRTDMEKLLSSRYFDNREIVILSPEDYTLLANGAVYSSCVNVPLQYVTGTNIETLAAGRFILEYSDDLAEIMENIVDKYISDVPCYTIIIDGKKYKVPEEYSEAAARVYSTGAVSPTKSSDGSYIYYKCD